MHQRLSGIIFQALEGFANRLRLPGQIDNQRAAANDRDLPGKNCGRDKPQADLAHLLAETGHDLVGHRQGGLRGYVAWRRAGTAGGQNQIAALDIGQFFECVLDDRLFIGDDTRREIQRIEYGAR